MTDLFDSLPPWFRQVRDVQSVLRDMPFSIDPPPTDHERIRAAIDTVFSLPLRREEFATREAAKRAIWLRGAAHWARTRNHPLGRLMEDFYLAVHRGDSPAAHRLLPEVEAAAVAYHPSWDWQPLLALCARDVDALDSGQRPEELPPELIILGSMWMGEPAEDFELLTGLGFNRSALRLGERWPVQAALGETSRNIGEATGVESDIDPLDHVLKAALYLAKGDVDLRADPLTNVSKKVRRRQRRESLAELPQAEKDRLKPRGQRKLGFDPYDPGMQDKPTGEALTTSEVLRDKLQAALPYLRPAERQAVLEAWDAARQDVPLPRYWGDAYQRKFKALQRASKRTQGMGSAS